MLNELAKLLLSGNEVAQNLVDKLGNDYGEYKTWPASWLTAVIRAGVKARLSMELLRWIILKDFTDRKIDYDSETVNSYITGLYAEQKAHFEYCPAIYLG